MKFNIVSYLIGEGLGNVFKNKKSTFSAMLVMCISMLVFGLFFIIGENVNHIMETVQSSQEIQVFIKNDASFIGSSFFITISYIKLITGIFIFFLLSRVEILLSV